MSTAIMLLAAGQRGTGKGIPQTACSHRLNTLETQYAHISNVEATNTRYTKQFRVDPKHPGIIDAR